MARSTISQQTMTWTAKTVSRCDMNKKNNNGDVDWKFHWLTAMPLNHSKISNNSNLMNLKKIFSMGLPSIKIGNHPSRKNPPLWVWFALSAWGLGRADNLCCIGVWTRKDEATEVWKASNVAALEATCFRAQKKKKVGWRAWVSNGEILGLLILPSRLFVLRDLCPETAVADAIRSAIHDHHPGR